MKHFKQMHIYIFVNYKYLYIIEFDWMLENGRGVITALNDYTREKLNFEERDLVQNEQGIRTPLIIAIWYIDTFKYVSSK